MAGKKWTERDLDAPRRNDEDETLRYVVAGATEKGAVVECLTAQVLHRAVCQNGSRRHGRGSETEQEERKVRQVVVD